MNASPPGFHPARTFLRLRTGLPENIWPVGQQSRFGKPLRLCSQKDLLSDQPCPSTLRCASPANRFPTPGTSCTDDSAPAPAPSPYPSCSDDCASTPPESAPARRRPSAPPADSGGVEADRKSIRLNSSHAHISY